MHWNDDKSAAHCVFNIVYHIDELRKFEPELDSQSVGIIADRTDQSVVIG